MKILTVNLLQSGRVAYLGPENVWVDQLRDASLFSDEEADAVLAVQSLRLTEIAGAYLLDADEQHAPTGRDAVKERIRSLGPSVRADIRAGQERV